MSKVMVIFKTIMLMSFIERDTKELTTCHCTIYWVGFFSTLILITDYSVYQTIS
jgi:hypothetical protein